LLAISSGDLTENTLVDDDESKHTLVYHIDAIVNPSAISLAVGPFCCTLPSDASASNYVSFFFPPTPKPDTGFNDDDDDDDTTRGIRSSNSSNSINLDGQDLAADENDPRYELVATTTLEVPRMLAWIQSKLGQFPFVKLNFVFVDDGYSQTEAFSGVSTIIASTELLHDGRMIEQSAVTRMVLLRAIMQQYFGCLISPKSWSDYWAFAGAVGYLCDIYEMQFSCPHLPVIGPGYNSQDDERPRGEEHCRNEVETRLFYQQEAVAAMDNEESGVDTRSAAALCRRATFPEEIIFDPLIRLKSPLVFHLISRKMGVEAVLFSLKEMVSKVCASWCQLRTSMVVSSDAFIRQFRRTTASPQFITQPPVDESFFTRVIDNFVRRSRIPTLAVAFKFNTKQSRTEMAIRQLNIAGAAFTGRLGIFFRDDELHMSKTHTHDVHEAQMRVEVGHLDKQRRKHTKRAMSPSRDEKLSPLSAVASSSHAVSPVGNNPSSSSTGESTALVGLAPKDSELDLDEHLIATAPIRWIRIDPNREWLRTVVIRQTEEMWLQQLTDPEANGK
jgi:hypothetical protein